MLTVEEVDSTGGWQYGMEIFYLTKITEVQINDTINKYIMNMSGDYT